MSDNLITLYDYFRSSAAFRVRIALNLKGIKYQTIPVHLINHGGEQHTEQYKALNPAELVPTAIINDKPLTQSLAIIEYLEDQYPEPSLFPSDPFQKALVRSFALSIAADIHPLNNLRVLNYLKNTGGLSDQQKDAWYHHWITLGLSSLEALLKNNRSLDTYCFGKTPTLADVCLIPQLYNARRFNCDLAPYPTLVKIDENCRKLAAFEQASPKEPVSP